ncbi:conserved hypothetical protein [Trichinella spiralis]|uniref:hypothetical protein n=1 Tax=Trichinella spiralis TaxID=6334 RepID=UPI0001EFEB5D|nr:conserved hypothetical protein [Trichinella spiralis]
MTNLSIDHFVRIRSWTLEFAKIRQTLFIHRSLLVSSASSRLGILHLSGGEILFTFSPVIFINIIIACSVVVNSPIGCVVVVVVLFWCIFKISPLSVVLVAFEEEGISWTLKFNLESRFAAVDDYGTLDWRNTEPPTAAITTTTERVQHLDKR